MQQTRRCLIGGLAEHETQTDPAWHLHHLGLCIGLDHVAGVDGGVLVDGEDEMKEHNCVHEINEELRAHNSILSQALSLSGRELIALSTTKLDSKKRGRPINVFASYCPFCGIQLNKDMK